MKAVQYVYMAQKCYLLHGNVEKINNREFRCKDCGATWKESITSPLVLEDGSVDKYYPKDKLVLCNTK